MGFALKKFIASFLMPIPLSLTLFLLGFLLFYKQRYKKAKYLFIISFIILFLSSNALFANFYISFLENQYQKYSHNQKIDYVLVLGSGHNNAKHLPLSAKLSSAAIKRVSEGIMVHKQNQNAKLILSGYGGRSDITQAQINAFFAFEFGVKNEDMILFAGTKDTFEELQTFKEQFKNHNFVLVTSAAHMPRAIAIAKKIDLNPIAAPTDFLINSNAKIYDFGAGNIKKVESATHEYLGLLWYKLRGYI